jgi:hypothetical protein
MKTAHTSSLLFFGFFLLLNLVSTTGYGQSIFPGTGLGKVQDMIGPSPSLYQHITGRLYKDTVRLKDLQLMSGTLIAQSKLPGTSAAITEKAITVNAGSRVFAFSDGGTPRFSIQGVVTGQAEDGFVNIFKSGAYQRTLGAGASFNWFFFGPLGDRRKTFYTPVEESRDSLHRELREQVALYLATNSPTAPSTLMAAAYSLQSLFGPPDNFDFKLLRDAEAVQDSSTSTDAAVLKRVALRIRYQKAIAALQPILPANWVAWSANDANTWVTSTLCTGGSIDVAKVNALYKTRRYKRFINSLDSIQLAKMRWKHRQLRWLSFKALANTDEQPIYDPAELMLMSKQHFAFADIRMALNNAHIWQQVRFFHSEGIGFNNQRVFDPDDLLTYQHTTTKNTGPTNTPTAITEESKFYAQAPGLPAYLVLDGQASVFWTKIKVGLDGTVKHKWGGEARKETATTLGVFVPVLAGESAINFMLQTKWSNLTQWTIGFNLAASIPGFLTSAKK